MTYIIKTIDGNRYELAERPKRTDVFGLPCLSFPVYGGEKHINLSMIISITRIE